MPKYKVALDALAVVERYVSSINAEKCRDIYEYIELECKTKELLNQSSFPNEVKQAIDRVTRVVLLGNIATVKLLEEENKREVELIAKESKRKNERIWRRIWKGVILILYVLVMLGAYRKENWTLIFLCVPISFVEKLLLSDTLALRLWARILTRAKNERC